MGKRTIWNGYCALAPRNRKQVGRFWHHREMSLTVLDRSAAIQPATKADRQIPAATLGVKKSAEKLRTLVGR